MPSVIQINGLVVGFIGICIIIFQSKEDAKAVEESSTGD